MENEITTELSELEEVVIADQAVNVAEQNYALAQAYANKGFRDYIENRVRNRMKELLMITPELLPHQQGRLIELKQLLGYSKKCFEDYKKLEK